MNTVSEFIIGEQYTNEQICHTLTRENMGGIRPSIGPDGLARYVVLSTATATSGKRKGENPYHDRIEGDILTFTGTGRKGDQKFQGKNHRPLEQYDKPIPLYGFTNTGGSVYRFLGLLELIRHYSEQQIDTSGKLRTVCVFEFYIHRQPQVVPVALASTLSAQIIGESKRANPMTAAEREVVTDTPSIQQDVTLATVEETRAQLLDIDPYRFEHLIGEILQVSGFRDVEVTKSSGDGGVDLNAYVSDENDFFGGTHVQVQAKRWRHSVGSIEINNFRGATNTSAKGVFITTSHYTKAALEDARNPLKPSISLLDGRRLATLLLNSGVSLSKYK